MPEIEGTCFVASPIGSDGSETREQADNLLENVIEPALEPFNLTVERADDIQEQGDITSQIIERLINAEFVIADLTGSNANVFYELAIRHAAEKPYLQLISRNDELPFDVQNTRTLPYDLNDVPFTNNAIREIREHIESQFEDDDPPESPVSIGMNLIQMRSTGERGDFELADILEMLSDIQSDISQMQNEVILQKSTLDGRTSEVEALQEARQQILFEQRVLKSNIQDLLELIDEEDLNQSEDIDTTINMIEIDMKDLNREIKELETIIDSL